MKEVRIASLRKALLQVAKESGNSGRLTSAQLEGVARLSGTSYARVLAVWGFLHATGQVFDEREELTQELRRARQRIAELEAEVARLRADAERMEKFESLVRDLAKGLMQELAGVA